MKHKPSFMTVTKGIRTNDSLSLSDYHAATRTAVRDN